jgi:hypothetical protein
MDRERLTEIKAEMERGAACDDYYVGGMASAGLGLELVEEIERLSALLEDREQAIRDYRG